MKNKKNIEKVFKLLKLSDQKKRDSILRLSFSHLEDPQEIKEYFILSTSNSLKEHKKDA